MRLHWDYTALVWQRQSTQLGERVLQRRPAATRRLPARTEFAVWPEP